MLKLTRKSAEGRCEARVSLSEEKFKKVYLHSERVSESLDSSEETRAVKKKTGWLRNQNNFSPAVIEMVIKDSNPAVERQ
jgi:hypothetical protein